MARKRPTSYVPLSVYYADDEAIMDAGEDAELMYVRMLAYAGRTPTTEGYVPKRVCLTRLGIATRPEVGPETAPERRLERLVEVGLITVERDGYHICAWLKWNRSVEEMGLERAQDRARKAALTRSAPETVPEQDPETVPELNPDSTPGSRGQKKKKKTEEDNYMSARRGRFDEFWKTYPSRGKHSNPKEPARQKWNDLVRTIDPDAIIRSARVLASTRVGEDPQHTPQAITWLRQKRFQDDAPAAESPTRPPERVHFTPPAPPFDMPPRLERAWNLACHRANREGRETPDWHDLDEAS